MESTLYGQLSDKPIVNLIADIADQGLSGLLCLRRDETAKVIYFEGGAAVFGTSDQPSEQLDQRLLADELINEAQLDEARQKSNTPDDIGWNLVDAGALTREELEESVRALAADIVLSVFEWEQGDYIFYSDPNMSLGLKLDWTPAECVITAARRAATMDLVATAIAPAEGRLVQTQAGSDVLSSAAALNSLEAFVLSTINVPTQVRDVSTLTGFSDNEARSAICVLLALGLLKLEEEGSQCEPETSHPVGNLTTHPDEDVAASGRYDGASFEWVSEMVARKLASTENADYYKVLGVERISPTSKITREYQEIKHNFDSIRLQWPEEYELIQAIDALVARIDEAYETLSDPVRRSAYDRPAGATQNRAASEKSRARTAAGTEKSYNSGSTGESNPPSVTVSRKAPLPLRPLDPLAMADEHYRRGRARFDRNDYYSAVHLFREAARLDPSQARHHYYLGLTLSILAQARQFRHSHTHDVGCHVTCKLGGGLARNPRLRREAEQHMLRAAELDRSNAEIRLRLARLYQDAGMEKKAGHYYLETLMLDSTNATALRELGMFDQRDEPRPTPQARFPHNREPEVVEYVIQG